MAKLTRFYHRIFGSTSTTTQMAAFGSYKNSAVQMTTDASTVASLPNWLVGMSEGVVNRNAPIIEELNGVLHHSSRQIAYLLQQGVAEYDPSTTYYTDSFVVHDSLIYQSIIDDNIGYDPTTSATTWQIYPKAQFPSYATTTAFTTARGAAVEGSSFYDSTLKKVKNYLNSSWVISDMSDANVTLVIAKFEYNSSWASVAGNSVFKTSGWSIVSDTHSAAESNGKFTIPLSGWYTLSFFLNTGIAVGNLIALFRVDGATSYFVGGKTNGSDRTGLSSMPYYFTAGQYIEAGFYDNTSESITSYAWAIQKICGK